eukprot:NODE_221_length_12388_cov_2.350883.p3 type:complete len:461 gc:universal NODE_221_length_12388_cov_2.350883:6292-7674(+)
MRSHRRSTRQSSSGLIEKESQASLNPDDSVSNISPQSPPIAAYSNFYYPQQHLPSHQIPVEPNYMAHQSYQQNYEQNYEQHYDMENINQEQEEPYLESAYDYTIEPSSQDFLNPIGRKNSGSIHNANESRNSRQSVSDNNASEERSKLRPTSQLVNPEVKPPKRHFPFFSYVLSIAHVVVLVIALFVNKGATGNLLAPITSNYMIGPDSTALIKTGARFVPCMKRQDFPNFKLGNCPRNGGELGTCYLSELCGFTDTDQWYRIITALFLHAGVIHLICNVFFQLSLLKDLERVWGWFLIFPIFMLSGSFSFLFGAAYAPQTDVTPSVGSSGALFGITAALIINLLIHWKSLHRPILQLVNLTVVIVISILFGIFVSFIDNYAHIGGFIMGIGNSLIFAPYEGVRNTLRRVGVRKSLIYSSWFPWTCRLIGIVWSVILFAFVAKDFYSNTKSCSICEGLSS